MTTATTRVLSTGLLLIGCLAISQPAFAFADDDARKAIVELRQQIRTLTEANQRARVQLADQIEALEQEVTRLRGDMEQLGRPSSGLGSPGGTSGARAPDVKSADPREQSAFDQSIESFRKGQYKEATENLNAFLTLYPDSKLTPTAQFYLGSSRYASKDFKRVQRTAISIPYNVPIQNVVELRWCPPPSGIGLVREPKVILQCFTYPLC